MTSSTPDIVGIDFSGAKDAGNQIWITTGTVSAGTLQVSQCERASDFFNIGSGKTETYTALVDWIDGLGDVTVGFDFPFSVPEVIANAVFQKDTWKDLVTSSRWSALNPDQFREQCHNFANGEIRDTDAMNRGDSPYSVRMYKQTFYGITDILKPLLQRDVSVAPMVSNGNTTVLETYPAATLSRKDGLFAHRYKNNARPRDRMQHNVQALATVSNIDITSVSDSTLIDDRGGDAFDSLIAAIATFEASHGTSPFTVSPHTAIEGHIFA